MWSMISQSFYIYKYSHCRVCNLSFLLWMESIRARYFIWIHSDCQQQFVCFNKCICLSVKTFPVSCEAVSIPCYTLRYHFCNICLAWESHIYKWQVTDVHYWFTIPSVPCQFQEVIFLQLRKESACLIICNNI